MIAMPKVMKVKTMKAMKVKPVSSKITKKAHVSSKKLTGQTKAGNSLADLLSFVGAGSDNEHEDGKDTG